MAKSRTIRARKKKFEQLRNLLGFCCCCITRRPDTKIVGIDDIEFDKTSNACADVLPSLVVGSAASTHGYLEEKLGTVPPEIKLCHLGEGDTAFSLGYVKEKLGLSGTMPPATNLGQLGPLFVGAASPAFTSTPAYLEEKSGTVPVEPKLGHPGQGDTGIMRVDNRTLSEMILDHMIMQIVLKSDRNKSDIPTRPPPLKVHDLDEIKPAHVERRGDNETLVRQLLYSIVDASTRTPSRPVPPTRPPPTYRNVVQSPQQDNVNMDKSEMMRQIVDEVIDDVLTLCEENSHVAVTPPPRPPAPKWGLINAGNIVERKTPEIVLRVNGKHKNETTSTTKKARLPVRPPTPKRPPPVSAKSKPARPEKPTRVPARKPPVKQALPTRHPPTVISNVPSSTKGIRPEKPPRPAPPVRCHATQTPTPTKTTRPEKPPRPAPPVRHAQQKPLRPQSPKRAVKPDRPPRPSPSSKVAENTKHVDDERLSDNEVTQPADDYPEELNPFADDDDNDDDSNQAADDYPENLNPFSD